MDDAKKNFIKMEVLGLTNYNRPYVCGVCGGMMIFRGVGEYECENCHDLDYDDYGKTRNYIESHVGATTSQISENTGVSQKSIRQMLKESRFEITPESKTFLKCDICGVNIRHGSLCDKCEVAYNRGMEERERALRNKIAGYGIDNEQHSPKGEKRFKRDEFGMV